MNEPDVLVIGGGPAGVAAATELAHLGFLVTLAEQRGHLGGAVHRPFVGQGNNPLPVSRRHRRNWQRLEQRLSEAGDRIRPQFESVFLGADGDSRFLLDDRRVGRVIAVRPKAVVLAVGAIELVLPRPGWELPGVSTAGGMQVQLKETGAAPAGSILIAGTGPLPLALAAQLTAAGNPPIAVLERSQPFRTALSNPKSVFDGLRSWANVFEAIGYGVSLVQAGVPYKTGWGVIAIEVISEGLHVTCQHVEGAVKRFRVRHLALHDGLTSNANGLPTQIIDGVCIVRAGDCREVLGADAAITDGFRAAHIIARHLGQPTEISGCDKRLSGARRTQRSIAALCSARTLAHTSNTVICRCEGLRRADLDALQGTLSAREIRLVGRFGMGVCQGRFCTASVNMVAAETGMSSEPGSRGTAAIRWPLRPVSITALAAFRDS